MIKRIFRSTLFVAAVVLLCSLGIIMGVLYGYFDDVQRAQLRDELQIAAVGTELEGTAFLGALSAHDYRITWVAADGTVLYDSSTDAAAMENHADREEIRQALETGTGSSVRQSMTALERTIYEAVRLSDGTVLRISMSQRTMLILVVGMLHPFFVVIAIAIIVSAILSHRIAQKIVEPLNTLDLEHPLENDAYEELKPLLQRINRQHIQITAQMQELKQKANEFHQITSAMQEGLVLLDRECTILSINSAAQALFSVSQDCVGKNFLLTEGGQFLRGAVNAALDKGHGTTQNTQNGRIYRFDLSRICTDGETVGVVVLSFDVTEQMNAEQTRREFSANVSHELKTPLQGIIGSAELLENGLIKPEDTPRFVGHIRREAARLVNLVEDIIRLSQLDEGISLPTEDVDLLQLSREVAALMQSAAQAKSVSIIVKGESCMIRGVRRLLHEIVYNLCDNAIRYNVSGGSVTVTVTESGLTVADTGIGIPPEHHSRVFERFYRVDKSHSKQSGGTGLGLSIVKHAAALHGARLELSSTPGEGTTISVIFN